MAPPKSLLILIPLLLLSNPALTSPLSPRAQTTASVHLNTPLGTPAHLASGFIYGIPDTPHQIPSKYYTDIGFNYGRAGGAQLKAPNRGWIWGMSEYKGRMSSYLSNYRTAREYNATMILLPHDIWGTDGTNESTIWPGDNGNWTDWEKFVKQMMADLKAEKALEGLVVDIWNEPDISVFWKRSRQQWIEMYIRAHKIIRADAALDKVLISGPSLAYRPLESNFWWTDWLAAIKGNETVPDQWAYHLEGGTGDVDNDLQTTNGTLKKLLEKYKLPDRQVNINEYANSQEQIPAGAAWWIARLERYGAIGLRGNWLGGWQLHDLMANLLTKKKNAFDYNATDYTPVGEWWVYRYYNMNMTGKRVATTGSDDRLFDVYATVGDDKVVRVLAGARRTLGTWEVKVDGLSAVGLPSKGSVSVKSWKFVGKDVWQQVDGPVDAGSAVYNYDGDAVTWDVKQTDNTTAWAFEFSK